MCAVREYRSVSAHSGEPVTWCMPTPYAFAIRFDDDTPENIQ